MEPQFKTGKWQIIAKFGLIYSLIVIGSSLLLYIFDLALKLSILNNVISLVALGGAMYFGIVSYRNNTLGGFISYGKSLGTGFLVSLVGGLILTSYQIIFTKFIDPDFSKRMVIEAKRKMIEDGTSEREIEQAMKGFEMMNSPVLMFTFGILAICFIGLIVAAIISIFTKKDDPNGAYRSLES